MVPLYAIASFISLFSLQAAFFIDAIRDIYEVSILFAWMCRQQYVVWNSHIMLDFLCYRTGHDVLGRPSEQHYMGGNTRSSPPAVSLSEDLTLDRFLIIH